MCYKTSSPGYIWWMGKNPRYELSQSDSPSGLKWNTQAFEQSLLSTPGWHYPVGSEKSFFGLRHWVLEDSSPRKERSSAQRAGHLVGSLCSEMLCCHLLHLDSGKCLPCYPLFHKSLFEWVSPSCKDTLIKTISKSRFPETLRGPHKFTETLWLYQDWVMLWALHKAHNK